MYMYNFIDMALSNIGLMISCSKSIVGNTDKTLNNSPVPFIIMYMYNFIDKALSNIGLIISCSKDIVGNKL